MKGDWKDVDNNIRLAVQEARGSCHRPVPKERIVRCVYSGRFVGWYCGDGGISESAASSEFM